MEACPTVDELRRWRAGLTSDADSQLIQQHVAACSQVCQPLLDKLSAPDGEPLDEQPPEETVGNLDPHPRTPDPSNPTPGSTGWFATSRHPRTFGRFEVLELLGKGGCGAVYRAHDPQLDRDVALKIPSARLLQNDEQRERFIREARTAATLNHPHICPVYEAAECEGRPYIVMALVDGQSLAEIIDRGRPIPERATAGTVRKLALALAEAHRTGIIHRDLKPTNIMIDRRGQPVVMDFGLARRSDPDASTLTQEGAVLGTPAYMAPEQALSRLDQIGPATDIYALGLVLYEMLTARRPFSGTTSDVLKQVTDLTPKPPSAIRPEVDPRLDAICLKAISKDPADRYHSMRELADALAEYLKGSDAAPIEAQPLPAGAESNTFASGRRTASSPIIQSRVAWWPWLVASSAVAVAFSGWYLFPRSPVTDLVGPAVQTSAAVTVPEPIAQWDFDGDTPTAGGPRRRPGVRGSAAAFSASNDPVTAADDGPLHATKAVTLAAWVRPKSDGAAHVAGIWSDKGSYALDWSDGVYSFRAAFAVGGPQGTAVAIEAGGRPRAWSHLVGVYDGERLCLYVDGQLASLQLLSTSPALRQTPEFARDGRVPTALQESNAKFALGGGQFDGLIDEVEVWNGALGAEQVAALFGSYPPPTSTEDATVNLLVPAYFYPAEKGKREWDRLRSAARDVSVVAIANASSGPGNEADANYAALIHNAAQAGMRVIGYISTGHGKRPPDEVTADIDRWLGFYPEIGGFFFDEQASGTDHIEQYAELYNYAKKRLPTGLVVANPGVACDPGYFDRPAADIICIFDNKAGLNAFQRPPALAKVAAERLAAVLYGISDEADMQAGFRRAAADGVGHLFMTDGTDPNPWAKLPEYWDAEVAAFRQQ